MGKVQLFEIRLGESRVIYSPGEPLVGTVTVRLSGSLQYRGEPAACPAPAPRCPPPSPGRLRARRGGGKAAGGRAVPAEPPSCRRGGPGGPGAARSEPGLGVLEAGGCGLGARCVPAVCRGCPARSSSSCQVVVCVWGRLEGLQREVPRIGAG